MQGLRETIPMYPSDLECLNLGELVTEKVIDAYLRLIERRSLFYDQLPTVFAFDCRFREDWMQTGYEGVEGRLANVELLKKHMILFPLYLPEEVPLSHWSLIVVRPGYEEIRAYDSLGLEMDDEMTRVLDFLEEYARRNRKMFQREKWNRIETLIEVPKQTDAASCGVYVCVYAERICRNVLINRPICQKKARKTISTVLRRGRFDYEDFSMVEQFSWQDFERFSQGRTNVRPDFSFEPPSVRDPLLEELNRAIDDPKWGKRDGLFPPLSSSCAKVPGYDFPLLFSPSPVDPENLEETSPAPLETPMVVVPKTPSPQPSTSRDAKCMLVPSLESATRAPSPNDDGSSSPCLSMSTSDIEQSEGESREACPEKNGESKGHEEPMSAEQPKSSEAVSARQEEYRPLPEDILRRLEARGNRWTSYQKRNERIRVFRPDGTFFRMRTKKLMKNKNDHFR